MEPDILAPFSIEPTDSASERWERWLRRFDNVVVARDIATNARQKVMLLHYAGEAVFDLSEAVGVLPTDNFEQTKVKLTAYFTPRRHARLQQISKNCNFQDKNREIKSQIIQKCSMPKIRDKGLSEVNITLPQLLTYGRTLEATVQQAKIMSDAASNGTSVHAVSHDSQSFSSKQGDYGTPRFRASRVQGKSGSHRDHQVAGPSYDKPHYKQHQGKPPHWMSAKSCPGCGGQPHNRLKCKACGKTCRKCHKENHFASVCRSKEAHFKENYSTNDLCEDAYTLSLHHTTGNHTVKPYECTVSMAGKVVCLEIDTGASVSLISEREWGMIIESAPQLTLDTNNVPCLRTYAGNPIKPLGKIRLNVYHNNQQHKLPVLVVPGVGPNLLGRDWLSVLKLDWARVFKVDTDDLLRPYQEVFSDGLGALKVSDASYHKIVAVNQDGDNSKSSTDFEVQRLLRELTRARQASEHSQGWADFLERELLVHINARIAAEESHVRTLRRPSNTRLANKRVNSDASASRRNSDNYTQGSNSALAKTIIWNSARKLWIFGGLITTKVQPLGLPKKLR